MNKTPSDFKQPAFKNVVREAVEEVTRPQFKAAQKETQQQLETFKDDILGAVKRMLQEFKSEIAAMKDEIVAELQTTREESTIHKGQHDRFDNIEQRVEKLEHVHPHGHQAIP